MQVHTQQVQIQHSLIQFRPQLQEQPVTADKTVHLVEVHTLQRQTQTSSIHLTRMRVVQDVSA